MKRLSSFIVLLCLLLSVTGCAKKDIINFYYTRDPQGYVYGTADGVIVSEPRMAQGHSDDLTYILNFYLDGPLETGLVSPFPIDTELIGHSRYLDTLNVTLYGQFEQMKNIDFTVASTCLANTCFELTDVQYVTIRFTAMLMQTKIVTISRNNIMTVDDIAPTETLEAAQ